MQKDYACGWVVLQLEFEHVLRSQENLSDFQDIMADIKIILKQQFICLVLWIRVRVRVGVIILVVVLVIIIVGKVY